MDGSAYRQPRCLRNTPQTGGFASSPFDEFALDSVARVNPIIPGHTMSQHDDIGECSIGCIRVIRRHRIHPCPLLVHASSRATTKISYETAEIPIFFDAAADAQARYEHAVLTLPVSEKYNRDG